MLSTSGLCSSVSSMPRGAVTAARNAGIEIQVIGESTIGNLDVPTRMRLSPALCTSRSIVGNGFQALGKVQINIFALQLEAGILKLSFGVLPPFPRR